MDDRPAGIEPMREAPRTQAEQHNGLLWMAWCALAVGLLLSPLVAGVARLEPREAVPTQPCFSDPAISRGREPLSAVLRTIVRLPGDHREVSLLNNSVIFSHVTASTGAFS